MIAFLIETISGRTTHRSCRTGPGHDAHHAQEHHMPEPSARVLTGSAGLALHVMPGELAGATGQALSMTDTKCLSRATAAPRRRHAQEQQMPALFCILVYYSQELRGWPCAWCSGAQKTGAVRSTDRSGRTGLEHDARMTGVMLGNGKCPSRPFY